MILNTLRLEPFKAVSNAANLSMLSKLLVVKNDSSIMVFICARNIDHVDRSCPTGEVDAVCTRAPRFAL